MKTVWNDAFSLKGKYLPYLLFILSWVLPIFLLDKGIIPTHILPDCFVKEDKIIIVEKVEIERKSRIPLDKFVLFYNPKVDPIIAKQIGATVEKYSKKYNLPKRLVMGIIKKESTYSPLAHSPVAGGLMQVYPKFHRDKMEALGIKDPREVYHIDNNIHLGCWIFRDYLDQSNGNLNEAFHKYLSKNASEKEKEEYINDILIAWAKMEMMEKQSK